MALPAHLGYVALALLVGGESLGLLVPGETALLTAAVLAQHGTLHIWIVIPVAALSAIAGDNAGYALGRRGVAALLTRRGPFQRQRAEALARGERFFHRHGAPAVFLGRFAPFARVTVAWLAGTSRMPWPSFLRWNVAGAVAWATAVGMAGYALGAAAEAVVASAGLAALGLLAALALATGARRRLRASR